MARLYWRVKKDGKWTWRPANVTFVDKSWKKATVDLIQEILEEEE